MGAHSKCLSEHPDRYLAFANAFKESKYLSSASCHEPAAPNYLRDMFMCFVSNPRLGWPFFATQVGSFSRKSSAPCMMWCPTRRPLTFGCLAGICFQTRFWQSVRRQVIVAIFTAIRDNPIPTNPWRLSAHMLQKAILAFYTANNLWPRGLADHLECTQDWALKQGFGIRKLACPLLMRGFT